MFYLTTAANGLSIFWTRVIVGSIYGAVGLTLGVSLLDLSRRGIEASREWLFTLSLYSFYQVYSMGNYHSRIYG
jgi:hypothetical protein